MRFGLFRKSFRGRHASLSLSINAIVVLIMAITMLGLGLAFMKNSMGSTMKQFTNVNEDIKAEMIKDLQSSPDRLTFKGEDVKFKQGEKREIYFAIKNDLGTASSFTVTVLCTSAMDTANTDVADDIKINYFAQVDNLEQNKIFVEKMFVTIPATQPTDTYLCNIDVTVGGNPYAGKKFYLTVE